MRTVQYIHAHVLHSIVAREATRRRAVGEEVKKLERGTGAVELIAGVAGEVEAERLVVVENRRVDGAVEEDKDGIRRRRDHRGLDIGHEEVVVGLENGASGHGWVVDHHCLLVIVDGLDFVVPGGCQEEKVGAAVQHSLVLRCSAALVYSKWVLHRNGAAEAAAGEGNRGK